MKIVKPAVQIIEGDNLTRIFKAGTTCYRSEDRTTKTPEEFAKMLIARGHTAMLEHSEMAILVNKDGIADRKLRAAITSMASVSSCAPSLIRYCEVDMLYDQRVIYAGNIRAWRELLREANSLTTSGVIKLAFQNDIFFEDLVPEDDRYVIVNLTPLRIPEKPSLITAKFTVSRAIAMEMFRHRVHAADYECAEYLPAVAMSPAMESTRYVDMQTEVEFVEPHWWVSQKIENLDARRYQFIRDCEESEKRYQQRRKLGMKPQDARGALIEDVRTEIVLTAPVQSWVVWYRLRSAKAAHPDVRRVAEMFRKAIKDSYPQFEAILEKESE